jgi:hypothetical protein
MSKPCTSYWEYSNAQAVLLYLSRNYCTFGVSRKSGEIELETDWRNWGRLDIEFQIER